MVIESNWGTECQQELEYKALGNNASFQNTKPDYKCTVDKLLLDITIINCELHSVLHKKSKAYSEGSTVQREFSFTKNNSFQRFHHR